MILLATFSIYTYTIVYSSTAAFADKTPYCTAILESSDGTRFPALVEGYREGDPVYIGQTVRKVDTDAHDAPQYLL